MPRGPSLEDVIWEGLRGVEALLAADELDVAAALYSDVKKLIEDAKAEEAAARARRNTTYFKREHLLFPDKSPWHCIREGRDDMALIHFIRVNWETLDAIVAHLDPHWVAWLEGYTDARRTKRRRGPPNHLDATDHMALALAYLTSQCGQAHLQLLFGAAPATVSEALWGDAFPRLLEALRRMPQGRLAWPTHDEQREGADRIVGAFGPSPAPGRIFGFMESVRHTACNPGGGASAMEQLFNPGGSAGLAESVSVVVLDSEGCVVAANCDRPASTTEDECDAADVIMGFLIDRRRTLYGYVLAAGSAFDSEGNRGLLAMEDYRPPAFQWTPALRREWRAYQRAVHPPAERGMGHLEAKFPRLATVLPGDTAKRRAIIFCCLRLNNVMARCTRDADHMRAVFVDTVMRSRRAGRLGERG